jgi:hypothetical protein
MAWFNLAAAPFVIEGCRTLVDMDMLVCAIAEHVHCVLGTRKWLEQGAATALWSHSADAISPGAQLWAVCV